MKIKFLLLFLFILKDIFPQINSDTLITPAVISDSLKQDTSAALLGDTLKITRKDTLAPLHQSPFYSGSFFIPNHKMVFTDYRYAADFLELFPFTFILDQGFIGQPNEVQIYGTGFNTISYLQDGVLFNGREQGILFNDRQSNSLDLNNIQSESVDSIEIIPAPRGFLYSPVNNLVSVNFITKDFLPAVPYTRVKYYEGPSGEAMFDGIFSAMLFKKLNFYTDITNRNVEESYDNSSFSIWQATAKLKYFLSSKLNLAGGYSFIHSETGINGGVDVDSIRGITSNVDSILYSENLAPVVQPNALQKNFQHHFNLRMLWDPNENLKTDLNLYYKFYLNELNDIENYPLGVNLLNGTSKSKVLGGTIKESYTRGNLSLQLNLSYEHQDFIIKDRIQYDSVPFLSENSYYNNVFSISPLISIVSFDSNFVLSLFYKYNSREFWDLNGGGLDLFYKINPNYNFYFGYSEFEIIEGLDRVKTMEFGAKFNGFNSLLDIRILKREAEFITSYSELNNKKELSLWGFGFNGDINIWKIGLEFQSYYYLHDDGEPNEFQFRGGIFYKNDLFDSSLKLKTGFNVYYFGRYNFFVNNFQSIEINPSSRIDFTIAGEIQKSAIAYFAWENLLDENYYIVPYYPMPATSIRFGVAWEILN
jgi:hypothetical protein